MATLTYHQAHSVLQAALRKAGEIYSPEEIAPGILYPASEASSYVTGRALTIDGYLL